MKPDAHDIQPPARLIGSTGDIYEFSLSSISLGRAEDNQVVLTNSRKASRRHALIVWENGGYLIRDLDSKNGTWLNGSRLNGDKALQSGDRLRVGEFEFTFELIGAGDNTETETLTADYFRSELVRPANPLQIDFEAMQVFLNGKVLNPPLSPLEWKLLAMLYQQRGKVCSRDAIFASLYDAPDMTDIPLDTALETLVSRLRKRLEMKDPNHLPYIRAVRGTGYRLEI